VYEPGAVRRGTNLRAPLDAPGQRDREFWRVEPDVELFHFAHGAGQPVLVLHGGPGIPPDEPWAGLRTVDGFSFHFFHQRGCGRSTRPFDAFRGGSFFSNLKELERTLGFGAQIADVERVRRILGEERLVVVGHSFGALIATLYAAEFPEHVSALVLEAQVRDFLRGGAARERGRCRGVPGARASSEPGGRLHAAGGLRQHGSQARLAHRARRRQGARARAPW
jgi:proline iminopeptidase